MINLLLEAKADKSIPDAVDWMINWLAKTGLGKDPKSGTGNQSNFNNSHYYTNNLTKPDYNKIKKDAISKAKQEDIENEVERTFTEYEEIGNQAVKQAKENDKRQREQPHDQTMAESLVEQIVGRFSHPIDFERKGWAKMFIKAFTRIAFSECDFATDHPDERKLKNLEKCYLIATMLWLKSKEEGTKIAFGDDCDMEGISYSQLIQACKGHYNECLTKWNAMKEEYDNKIKYKRKYDNALKSLLYMHYYDENLNDREIEKLIEENPENYIPSEKEILDEIKYIGDDYETKTSTEEKEEQQEEEQQVKIPNIEEDNMYKGIPNPYMKNTVRCGKYNVTRINNFSQSQTWYPFQNYQSNFKDKNETPGVHWCISQSSTHWNSYLKGTNRICYFCWTDNFRNLKRQDYPQAFKNNSNTTFDTEWGRSLICVMVTEEDGEWKFVQATTRYNHADGRGSFVNVSDVENSGDNYINECKGTSDLAARTLSRIFGCSPEEIKEKLSYKIHDVNSDIEFIKNFAKENNFKSENFRRNNISLETVINKQFKIFIIYYNGLYYLIYNSKIVGNKGFYDIYSISDYLYKVTFDNFENIIDLDGNYLIPNDHRNINFIDVNNRFFVVCDNNKENIFDLKTKRYLLKKPVYKINLYQQNIPNLNSGVVAALNEENYKNKKYSLIDLNNKIISEEYSEEKLKKRLNNISSNNKDFTFEKNGMTLTIKTKSGVEIDEAYYNQFYIYYLNSGILIYKDIEHNEYHVAYPDGSKKKIYPSKKLLTNITIIPNTTYFAYTVLENNSNIIRVIDIKENPDKDGSSANFPIVHEAEYNFPFDININTYFEVKKMIFEGYNTTERFDNTAVLYNLETGEDLIKKFASENNIKSYKLSYYKQNSFKLKCILDDDTIEFYDFLFNPKTGVYTYFKHKINDITFYRNKKNNKKYKTIVYKDNKNIYLNETDCKRISDEYYSYLPIEDNLHLVKLTNNKNSKYIFIDNNGMDVLNFEFDKLVSFPDDDGIGVLIKNGVELFYNINGEVSQNADDLIDTINEHHYSYLDMAAYLC